MNKSWIKRILISIVSVFLVVALFGIIFIVSDIRQPTPQFFLELTIVLGLTVAIKVMWYEYGEDDVLQSDEIKKANADYIDYVDTNVIDSTDLENYLVILNQENKNHYINNNIGSLTAKSLAKKNWFMCLFHPSYRKLTKEEIGEIRYNKIYFKILRKADKIKPITSEELIALSESELLYDSKNHLTRKKISWQTLSTAFSLFMTTAIAIIGVKEFMLNPANAVRFIAYLAAIGFNIFYTLFKARKTTRTETLDHINRLRFIVDKYLTYKEVSNGNSTSK